ncbi:MAG: hemerythrin domain-containing protein [Mariprofundaceae bacterium]|nr:hemerythrin domain-containing protein [Mariprofundaceae bacterium]
MALINSTFTRQHRQCDAMFADAEAAAAAGNWQQAEQDFSAFAAAMECHLGNEEEILFPAFEERTGMSAGPTMVMRDEHVQIRGLIDEMKRDIEEQDTDHYLGISETLLILMQQHNTKEEQMLYVMCDRALGSDQADQVLGKMKDIG